MRPLIIQVPDHQGKAVIQKVQQFAGENISLLQGSDGEQEQDIVIAFIPNRQVEGLLASLESLHEPRITLFPQGVIPLYPPSDQAPEQVKDVQPRSPVEVFLSGLQSKGSWKGFLGYALVASLVVWVGLFTNTSYLLVGAMLIAPFAGPAMNTAIATARGDIPLLRQGLIRYFVSIFITITGTLLLSLIFQQEVATAMMVDTSQISSITVLLPIAAGAAGALNLVQSERDSLVSGAAVGLLVAASLAPPAGVVGMSIAIGKWQMAKGGLFLLLLQLVGINLSGSLVFRLYGLSPQGPRYHRGSNIIFRTSLLATAIVLAGLLFWQLSQKPNLQRSSISQRAVADIQKILEAHQEVKLVEANADFTRADIQGQNSLLCTIYVQQSAQKALPSDSLKNQLTRVIQQGLKQRDYTDITPLVSVTVLQPPS